jgi:hypothetical protein
MKFSIQAFCLKGYDGEKISLEINEVSYPDEIGVDGGHNIICTIVIDVGCYHLTDNQCFSATGALYRFCEELKKCYESLEGVAIYKMTYDCNLTFGVEMLRGGHATIRGEYRERLDSESCLTFEIRTDQTCLLSAIKSIENLKKQFDDCEG